MKYIVIKSFGLLFLLLFLLSACKTKKAIGVKLPKVNEKDSLQSIRNKEEIINSIVQQQNTFNYLACRSECEFNDGKAGYNLDLILEMEKGKFIFLKATYLLGIEVARMLITPSQIQIVDHWNKTNTIASYSYLKRFSSAPIQFENLENLFVGNALFNPEKDLTNIDSNQTQLILKTMVTNILQTSFYNKGQVAKISSNNLQDSAKGQEIAIEYKQFFQNGTNYYPSELSINIMAEKNIGCSMKLFNFVFEKKKEPQIRVPNSYKTLTY